ncbi:MAG: elongation factor G, partial [Myxococcales bacterium]|nr:elongation factor G [Myxococcales bacterium]
ARKLLDTIKEGVENSLAGGVIQGDPVVDLKVSLVDVGFEDNENANPLGYHIAAGLALRDGMQKGNPILLQPLMKIEIFVPEENLGDIIGDMSARGGHIEDVSDSGIQKLVQAKAPLKAMFGYSTSLRSMTQGRGTFSMEFARFGSLNE